MTAHAMFRNASASICRVAAPSLIGGARWPQDGPRSSASATTASSSNSEKNRRQLSSTAPGFSRKRA